ncbi:50S ribosomal protein L11 methyltransferase [Soehngenia saccharolytica]|nr:50S ribosomal protein L11 methyltransferase [Soehngenia saccharolytica]
MKWYEFLISTNRKNEDLITYILYDIGAKGLEIVDRGVINEIIEQKDKWDFIDETLQETICEDIIIKAYFSEVDDIDLIKTTLNNRIVDENIGSLSINVVDESEWEDNWKAFFNTMRIGENIIIKPTWENYLSKASDIVIELDPGMAFGTGTHETTYMCAQALEKLGVKGKKVFDIGCGSGILSIIAAKLGAKEVIGIDLDMTSVEVAKKNILNNNVSDIVEIRHGDLLSQITDKADVIVMNIVAEIVADVINDLNKYLTGDGIFICSGIIDKKKDIVINALNRNSFDILEINNTNDWICIVAKRR